MKYTIKDFMNKKFMIESFDEAYLQIINYLFKTNASLDKNIVFYHSDKDNVVAVDVYDDFLDCIDWEEFYINNEKEIKKIMKADKQEFEWGAAAVKIENEEQLNKLKENYELDFYPKNFIYNIYYYYNREDKKLCNVLNQYYGPVIKLEDILN